MNDIAPTSEATPADVRRAIWVRRSTRHIFCRYLQIGNRVWMVSAVARTFFAALYFSAPDMVQHTLNVVHGAINIGMWTFPVALACQHRRQVLANAEVPAELEQHDAHVKSISDTIFECMPVGVLQVMCLPLLFTEHGVDMFLVVSSVGWVFITGWVMILMFWAAGEYRLYWLPVAILGSIACLFALFAFEIWVRSFDTDLGTWGIRLILFAAAGVLAEYFVRRVMDLSMRQSKKVLDRELLAWDAAPASPPR